MLSFFLLPSKIFSKSVDWWTSSHLLVQQVRISILEPLASNYCPRCGTLQPNNKQSHKLTQGVLGARPQLLRGRKGQEDLSEGLLVLTSRPLGKRREPLMFDLNKLEDLNNLNNPTASSNSNQRSWRQTQFWIQARFPEKFLRFWLWKKLQLLGIPFPTPATGVPMIDNFSKKREVSVGIGKKMNNSG